MATASDILVDDSNELATRRGDFAVGFSDDQHQIHIGTAEKGNYNQFPTVGVGVKRYLNGSTRGEEIARDYRLELEKDGYEVRSILVRDGQISIDAERIR